jgi:hypothetical protein
MFTPEIAEDMPSKLLMEIYGNSIKRYNEDTDTLEFKGEISHVISNNEYQNRISMNNINNGDKYTKQFSKYLKTATRHSYVIPE